jgi:AcrR family transcriptional regulator
MREQPETTRGRGRPRSFDPDDALDAAIALFWAKGYDATSLDDLGAAMNMGRPSIYRAFGAKDQLFLKALARYRDTVAAGPVTAMRAAPDVQSGIVAFLEATVAYVGADAGHHGCLIGTIATATDDDAARGFAAEAIDGIQAAVAERLTRAVADGELGPDLPVARAARRAVDAMLTLTARARLGTTEDELRATIADHAALILQEGR